MFNVRVWFLLRKPMLDLISRDLAPERGAGDREREESPAMIDTMRSDFPADMSRAADFPLMGNLEGAAADLLDHLKDYARDHPASFGLWALGIGFVLGWKLKPW